MEHPLFNVDAPYYFNGHERWNMAWSSPTLAAVFICSLLPFLCAWECHGDGRFRGVRTLLPLVEAAALFCMIKTYSRGGALGVLLVYGFRFRLTAIRIGPGVPIRLLGARVCLVGAFLLLTGAAERIAPGYLQNDGSARSHIGLIVAGARMVSLAPLRGWGSGGAGIGFGDWFQGATDPHAYRGLVNTFLDVCVEHGIVVAGLILIPVLTILCLPSGFYKTCRPAAWLLISTSSCALLGFLVSVEFVSVGESWSLYAIPSLALLLAMGCLLSYWRSAKIPFLRAMSRAALATAALFIVVLSAGHIDSQRDAIRVVLKNDQWMLLERANVHPAGHVRYAFLPTTEVMGLHYGREVRNLLMRQPNEGTIAVARTENLTPQSLSSFPEARVVCFGGACALASSFRDSRLILFHPTVPPPASAAPNVADVVLPHFDECGNSGAWEKWCAEHDVPVRQSEFGGIYAPAESIDAALTESGHG